MASPRASLVCLRLVVVLVLGLGVVARSGPARADGGTPSRLAIDEPKSGLHLDVEGACLARIRDAEAGTVTCPELAVRGDSEAFAVVTGDGSAEGPRYAVEILVETKLGTGEDRARRAAMEMDEALVEPPIVVTYGDQRFVRAHFRAEDTRGLAFLAVDERPELATILFVSVDADPAGEVEKRAEAVMTTVRRVPRNSTSAAGAESVPSKGSDALVIAFLVVVVGAFGLFVFLKLALIARLFGFKLGSLGGDGRPVEEPRRPRDPGLDGPQVAGMKCAACRRNILSDFDGMTCADCREPIHKKCHGKHVTGSHAAPTPGAYR
jgi:hypothetical protein